MTWLRVDTSLAAHRKTRALALDLNIKRREAVGLLVALWSYISEYHETGDVTDADWRLIAQEAEFAPGRGDELRKALVRARFLDVDNEGRATCHDWEEYHGTLLTRRMKDKARKANFRKKARIEAEEALALSGGRPADILRTSSGSPDRTERNETERNGTKRKKNSAADAAAPEPSWPGELAVILGGVSPGRAGKALKFFVDHDATIATHGIPLLIKAAECYRRTVNDMQPKDASFYPPQRFFTDVAYWVDRVRPLQGDELTRAAS